MNNNKTSQNTVTLLRNFVRKIECCIETKASNSNGKGNLNCIGNHERSFYLWKRKALAARYVTTSNTLSRLRCSSIKPGEWNLHESSHITLWKIVFLRSRQIVVFSKWTRAIFPKIQKVKTKEYLAWDLASISWCVFSSRFFLTWKIYISGIDQANKKLVLHSGL